MVKLLTPEVRNMYTTLRATVDRFLSRSKYANIKLSTLYLNYVINPNSRQPKIYPVKELADTIASAEKSSSSVMKAGRVPWGQYLNYE